MVKYCLLAIMILGGIFLPPNHIELSKEENTTIYKNGNEIPVAVSDKFTETMSGNKYKSYFRHSQLDGDELEEYNCIPTTIDMYLHFYKGIRLDRKKFKSVNFFELGYKIKTIKETLDSYGIPVSMCNIEDIEESLWAGDNVFILVINTEMLESTKAFNSLHVGLVYYDNFNNTYNIIDPMNIKEEIKVKSKEELENFTVTIYKGDYNGNGK